MPRRPASTGLAAWRAWFSRPAHSTALPPLRGRGPDASEPDRPTLPLSGSTLPQALVRRGGRVAEGTRLLSEYGVNTPSRVRIPPSPLLPPPPAPGPMKVFISSERAPPGSSTGRAWASGADYELGQRLLADEVNAAIDGAVDAGAGEILVNDAEPGSGRAPSQRLLPVWQAQAPVREMRSSPCIIACR
jgi:D-aminopeptidase